MADLRRDAEAIWSAAVRAVAPERLVAGCAAALRDAVAAAERVAWGANEEEEYVPARKRTAWVEPEQPSFGVPTRHDVLIGQRRAGSSGAGAAPARY